MPPVKKPAITNHSTAHDAAPAIPAPCSVSAANAAIASGALTLGATAIAPSTIPAAQDANTSAYPVAPAPTTSRT